MNENDGLLLEVEKKCFPDRYCDYYGIKRNNFFAGITNLPDIWHCFMLLDEIFARELDDLHVISEMSKFLPFVLFVNVHTQFRIFLELGFSGAFVEAYNVARMTVESCYHACKIFDNAELAKVWFLRAKGEREEREFGKVFDRGKEEGYSALGLQKLHGFWKKFSGWSHTSAEALSRRFNMDMMHYLETDPKTNGLNLMELLRASNEIEAVFYRCFKDRLKFDVELEKMRARFVNDANGTRVHLIKRFNISPPVSS